MLLPRLSPLLRPGKVEHRNREETVTVIRQPSERDIPRQKSSQQREQTASFDDGGIGHGGAVAVNVADTQEEEGDVDGDKNGGEGEGGFEAAEDEEEGEDEPALHSINLCAWD